MELPSTLKLSLAIASPEIGVPLPVALLAGTFAERLQRAAALGYDGVELFVARPAELDSAAICRQLSMFGLTVSALGTGALPLLEGLTLLAPDERVRQNAFARLLELIELGAAIGAPFVTIGSFRGRVNAADVKGTRAALIEFLQRAADYAAGRGVRLVLEPLNRYEADMINNASQCLALLEELARANVGLLLDTFHMNIEEASLYDSIQQGMLAGRLWHIHIGDSNRLSPGSGHLDMSGIVRTLRETNYEGFLSAELLPLPDPDTAAAATIRTMREFIPKGV